MIPFDKDKHRLALYNILTGMFRNDLLASTLGFKGGTACYFFYDLPRMSVDLDFDIVEKKDDAGDLSGRISAAAEKILKGQGLVLKDAMIKRNTIFFLASYGDKAKNIKIEMSQREYPNTYEIKSFYGIPMRVMVRADMCAHKLVAATDRKKTAARDFFDIHFFLKEGWPVNDEIIKVRTGIGRIEYLRKLKTFIQQHLNSRSVLQGLGELLSEKQKVWVKGNMKQEIEGLLDFYCGSRG